MNKTTVKLCGLQSIEIIQAIKGLAVDQIGFIFAKSRRQVSPQLACDMMQHLHRDEHGAPLAAGVFVNPTKDELSNILDIVPLDIIQLHGTESADMCRWVKEVHGKQVFKVMSIARVRDEQGIVPPAQDEQGIVPPVRGQHAMASPVFSTEMAYEHCAPYAEVIDALLLDTYDPIVGGGTGETFAWEHIVPYQAWTKEHHIPLIIAGGLHVGNVAQLIRTYAPDGVDVSSGVETNGEKDIVKMAQFIDEVKGK